MGTKAELMDAAQDIFSGQLKPIVDRTYPPCRSGGGATAARSLWTVRESSVAPVSTIGRISVSLFTVVAVIERRARGRGDLAVPDAAG